MPPSKDLSSDYSSTRVIPSSHDDIMGSLLGIDNEFSGSCRSLPRAVSNSIDSCEHPKQVRINDIISMITFMFAEVIIYL